MFVFLTGAVLGATVVLMVLLLAALVTEDWSRRGVRPRRRATRRPRRQSRATRQT